MARLPKWAESLILDACLYWEQRYSVPVLPDVKWRKCNRVDSSGHASLLTDTITINAGRERRDAKLVVLHELAHIFAGPGEYHSDTFWDIAWELYRRFKVPIRYAKQREGEYRKGALLAYRRSLSQERS